MSKNKRFEPNAGLIMAVHQNIFFADILAEKLNVAPLVVAKALEDAGLKLEYDIFNLSADTAKVMITREKGTVKPSE
jgi:hypothetical protein